MSDENPLTQLQKQRNSGNATAWGIAASHRNRVTELILDRRVEAAPTLCVLGAGNCNDLDLQRLTSQFQRIDLVDIDQSALERGIAAQQLTEKDGIDLNGSCDLTGVWADLARLRDSRDEQAIDRLIAQSAAWPGLTDLGSFGTVVSTCVLSQLIEGVINTLGESHPRCLEVIEAVRQRHLRLLHELTAPGGNAILFTDFVSSDTAPNLPSLSGEVLSRTLLQMIKQHNFFTGLNPARLQMLLHEGETIAGKIDSIFCETPWLWNFGARHYAVTAISFRKVMCAD